MINAEECLPPDGSSLRQAFEALLSVLSERGVRYAIIGGIAALQYTRARTTEDVDVLVAVPQLSMPGLFETMEARGFKLDVARSIRELRDDGMTTIQFADVIVDLLRPLLPVYAHVLDRAVDADVFGKTARISSAEDLIIMKMISMRARDEADIRDLIAASAGDLDVEYIRGELEAIMDAQDPRRIKFESWIREIP